MVYFAMKRGFSDLVVSPKVSSIFIFFDSATRAFWNFYFRKSSVVPFWYVLHTYIVCPTSWESSTPKIGRMCQATPGRCPDDSNLPERSICCVKKREYDFTDTNIEDVCTQEQYVLPTSITRWLNSVMSDKFRQGSSHQNSIPTLILLNPGTIFSDPKTIFCVLCVIIDKIKL